MASVPPQSQPLYSLVKPSNLFPHHRQALTFKNLTKVSSARNSDSNAPDETDPVKLALFAKAKAYKKSLQTNPAPKIVENQVQEPDQDTSSSEEEEEVPLAFKLALEKAKEYKKNKGVVSGSPNVQKIETSPGLTEGSERVSGAKLSNKNADKKEELTVSSIDFVGLGFSDKKQGRGLPPGLVPVTDPFPEGDLPEVEILVGDTSKFEEIAASNSNIKSREEDTSDLYKPKVSTWGVFPRPNDISKTYGGGRTIRPGQVLESAEDKAAKQARTRELLAAYKRKIGLNIDPKLKAECEKALNEGDSLMDLGKLKEALPIYETVMDKLPFQSELHGLAALQWSICQDSLSRPNEARVMYEKLQSHPNVPVSKKAKQFMFGFQAMEMMKVNSTRVPPLSTGYQNYFEAFVRDKVNYSLKEGEVEDEVLINQALPYMIFLLLPIFMVLFIAAQKGASP